MNCCQADVDELDAESVGVQDVRPYESPLPVLELTKKSFTVGNSRHCAVFLNKSAFFLI